MYTVGERRAEMEILSLTLFISRAGEEGIACLLIESSQNFIGNAKKTEITTKY